MIFIHFMILVLVPLCTFLLYITYLPTQNTGS